MKTSSSRHLVSLVSMLIFLLTGQAGMQGYVWCLGDDGDTALEFAAGDSCNSIAQKQDQACHAEGISSSPASEEHCGPCSDLPASFDAASRRPQDHDDISIESGLTAIAQVHSIPSSRTILTSDLYPNPPPRISQTILAHRTVVLLN